MRRGEETGRDETRSGTGVRDATPLGRRFVRVWKGCATGESGYGKGMYVQPRGTSRRRRPRLMDAVRPGGVALRAEWR